MQSGVGARTREDTTARETLQTRGRRKNNKALIKADNLKGLLGYPTCKLAECISAILKIEDKEDLLNQFSRPATKDEEQFGRIEERP